MQQEQKGEHPESNPALKQHPPLDFGIWCCLDVRKHLILEALTPRHMSPWWQFNCFVIKTSVMGIFWGILHLGPPVMTSRFIIYFAGFVAWNLALVIFLNFKLSHPFARNRLQDECMYKVWSDKSFKAWVAILYSDLPAGTSNIEPGTNSRPHDTPNSSTMTNTPSKYPFIFIQYSFPAC